MLHALRSRLLVRKPYFEVCYIYFLPFEMTWFFGCLSALLIRIILAVFYPPFLPRFCHILLKKGDVIFRQVEMMFLVVLLWCFSCLYPHRASWKICLITAGIKATYLWSAGSVLCKTELSGHVGQYGIFPVNCNTTGTLTQYKSSVNSWSQVSFSEFWDEILNAKDQTVYQIEAIKKLHLI